MLPVRDPFFEDKCFDKLKFINNLLLVSVRIYIDTFVLKTQIINLNIEFECFHYEI